MLLQSPAVNLMSCHPAYVSCSKGLKCLRVKLRTFCKMPTDPIHGMRRVRRLAVKKVYELNEEILS